MLPKELFDILVSRLDKLEYKQDKVFETAHKIDKTVVQNTADLQEHMRRTDLLERRVEQVAQDLDPVKKHVGRVKWLVGAAIVAIGVAAKLGWLP